MDHADESASANVEKVTGAGEQGLPNVVRCGECGHYFDADDPRGVIFKNPKDDLRYGKTCPRCYFEEHEGAPAWALWNSCQGVFTCSVTHTRAEAEELLKRRGWEGVAEVRPVRVFAEREDRIWYRECDEREKTSHDERQPDR